MTSNLTWIRSSYSGSQGGNCVEIARPDRWGVLVRDSKNPDGPVLKFSAGQWRAFTCRMKAGKPA